ncbi:DNA polymerase alpha catalytic subunit-like [Arctopsyche grandis]|uniref:DNA polymerase alpha catalytic subunit-like n=1 Tax=Arctopsyche grandis TaxID=121162 RepID=UPI00406D7A28
MQFSEKCTTPPLTIATIHCRTVIDPKTRHNMIVMLTCLISNSFEIHKPPTNPPFQQHFCVFTRSSNEIWPADLKQMLNFKGTKLTKCESERELLSYFLVQFWKLDPDLVVGHDLLRQ